jgi:translation initiation factor 4A
MTTAQDIFQNYELSEEIPYIDKFDDERLGLDDEILHGIYSYGYDRPSPIQRIAIQPILSGRDVVVQSHSGSGKTATFIIGMLQRLDKNVKRTQCLIVSNTRELAKQTYNVYKEISKFTSYRCKLCVGGDLQHKYTVEKLNEDVIIGTPGRMCDLLSKDIIDIEHIKIMIVDEADDVLSIGFRKQIKRIFQKIPQQAQVVLVSATIPDEMHDLFTEIMKPDNIQILVRDDELTLKGISQYYIQLDEMYKLETFIDLYKYIKIGQAIVYCNKKHRAEELRNSLVGNGFTVGLLHGDMMQREREDIMQEFRKGEKRILITTDILSRGIDIQQVSLVINYDMPKYSQNYIHRIGRSGRYARKGVAINFVTRREMNILYSIENAYGTKIEPLPQDVHHLI